MGGMDWNAEADQKLLLFILHTNPGTVLNYPAAAAMLSQGGSQCTEEALRHHIRKLKKNINANHNLKRLTDAATRGELEVPKGARRSAAKKKSLENDVTEQEDPSQNASKKRKLSQFTKVIKEEAAPETTQLNVSEKNTLPEFV